MEKLIRFFKIEKIHIKLLTFIAIVIIISSSILSYINTQDLINSEKEVSITAHNIEVLESLRDNLTNAQTGRDFYLITGEQIYLDPYNKATNEIDTIYSKLKIAIADKPDQKFYFDTLTMLVRERFQLMNRSIELQNKKGTNERTIRPLITEGKVLQDKIISLINRMKNEEKKILNYKTDSSNYKAKFTIIAMTASTIFSIILLTTAFSLLNKGNDKHLFETSSPKMTAEELETIVRQRTEEISQINKKLYAELDTHKRMEEALKKSELEYRMLFEQAHDAIIIFTPLDAIVLDVNDRACEVYKISKKDFIGLSIKSVSKNIPDELQHIKNTVEKGFYYNFQAVHYKKEGSEMLMEINASLINFKGQRAILSINRDITDRILSYIPLPGS